MEGRFITVQKTRIVTRCAYCNSENSYNKNGFCKNCGANEQVQQEETYLTKEYVYDYSPEYEKKDIEETIPKENKKDCEVVEFTHKPLDKGAKIFIFSVLAIILIIGLIASILPLTTSTNHWVSTSCNNCGEHIEVCNPSYAYFDISGNIHFVSENYKEVAKEVEEIEEHEMYYVLHCDKCNKDTLIKD